MDFYSTNLPQDIYDQLYLESTQIQIKLQSLTKYIHNLKIAEAFVIIYNNITCINIILNSEDDHNIDKLVKSGLVPSLINLAKKQILPQLTVEITWILAKITNSNPNSIDEVVQNGGIELFVDFLKSKELIIQEHAICGIGHIAEASTRFRDKILLGGAVDALIQVFKERLQTLNFKNLTWCLSNICVDHQPAQYEKLSKFIAIFCYAIQYNTEEETLEDSLWSLSYLNAKISGGQRASKMILESNIINRIIDLIGNGSLAIQLPALRLIGSLLSGDSASLIDQDLSSNILKWIPFLLKHPEVEILLETYWILSVMVEGNQQQMQAIIRDARIFESLIHSIHYGEFKQAGQATIVLSNSIRLCDMQDLQFLIEKGILQIYKKLLQKHLHLNIYFTVIRGVSRILKKGKQFNQKQYLIDIKAMKLDRLIYKYSKNFQEIQVSRKYEKLIKLL